MKSVLTNDFVILKEILKIPIDKDYIIIKTALFTVCIFWCVLTEEM